MGIHREHRRERGSSGSDEGFIEAAIESEYARGSRCIGDERSRLSNESASVTENEGVLNPAGRRRTVTEGPRTCVLPESGICSCKSGRDPWHQFSALSAGGEVQELSLSCTGRLTECVRFTSFMCVCIGCALDGSNGTASSSKRSINVRASAHIDGCTHAERTDSKQQPASAGPHSNSRTFVAVGAQGA